MKNNNYELVKREKRGERILKVSTDKDELILEKHKYKDCEIRPQIIHVERST